ncbi:MAG: outer membrane beta-barrel protein [Verrucomicrobiota bacterium]
MNRITIITGLVACLSFAMTSGQSGEYFSKAPIDTGAKVVYEDPSTFYVFGFGGVNFVDGETGLVNGSIPLLLELDDGYTFGGGAGVRTDFLGGSRFEIEGFYGENDVIGGAINGNAGPFSSASGVLETYGGHVNLVKEFDLGGIKPYVGGGIGYTEISAENVAYGPINFSDRDGAFSWQIIAGLEVPITDNVGVYVEYNYHSVGEVAFQRSATTVLSFDDLTNHSVQGGVRIAF